MIAPAEMDMKWKWSRECELTACRPPPELRWTGTSWWECIPLGTQAEHNPPIQHTDAIWSKSLTHTVHNMAWLTDNNSVQHIY